MIESSPVISSSPTRLKPLTDGESAENDRFWIELAPSNYGSRNEAGLHTSMRSPACGWADRPWSPARCRSHFPLDFAWESALAAIARVRADERPSLSAFDALLATALLVTRLEELFAMRPYLLSHPCAMYAGAFAVRSEEQQRPVRPRAHRFQNSEPTGADSPETVVPPFTNWVMSTAHFCAADMM